MIEQSDSHQNCIVWESIATGGSSIPSGVRWLYGRSCRIFSHRMIILVEPKARKKREEEGNEEEGGKAAARAAAAAQQQQHGVEKGKPRWSSTTGRPRRCTLTSLSATESRRKEWKRKREKGGGGERAKKRIRIAKGQGRHEGREKHRIKKSGKKESKRLKEDSSIFFLFLQMLAFVELGSRRSSLIWRILFSWDFQLQQCFFLHSQFFNSTNFRFADALILVT